MKVAVRDVLTVLALCLLAAGQYAMDSDFGAGFLVGLAFAVAIDAIADALKSRETP